MGRNADIREFPLESFEGGTSRQCLCRCSAGHGDRSRWVDATRADRRDPGRGGIDSKRNGSSGVERQRWIFRGGRKHVLGLRRSHSGSGRKPASFRHTGRTPKPAADDGFLGSRFRRVNVISRRRQDTATLAEVPVPPRAIGFRSGLPDTITETLPGLPPAGTIASIRIIQIEGSIRVRCIDFAVLGPGERFRDKVYRGSLGRCQQVGPSPQLNR